MGVAVGVVWVERCESESEKKSVYKDLLIRVSCAQGLLMIFQI